MKYVFLAFKTIAAVLIVLGIAVTIYVIKGTNEYFDRMGEEARIINENKEIDFKNLCDFAENNLSDLTEFSDYYISMLSPENTLIKIETEGDMQDFRNKLFDNVFEAYAVINDNDDKYVRYTGDRGEYTLVILVFEMENSLTSVGIRNYMPMEKDINDRVFVYVIDNEH